MVGWAGSAGVSRRTPKETSLTRYLPPSSLLYPIKYSFHRHPLRPTTGGPWISERERRNPDCRCTPHPPVPSLSPSPRPPPPLSWNPIPLWPDQGALLRNPIPHLAGGRAPNPHPSPSITGSGTPSLTLPHMSMAFLYVSLLGSCVIARECANRSQATEGRRGLLSSAFLGRIGGATVLLTACVYHPPAHTHALVPLHRHTRMRSFSSTRMYAGAYSLHRHIRTLALHFLKQSAALSNCSRALGFSEHRKPREV